MKKAVFSTPSAVWVVEHVWLHVWMRMISIQKR